MPRLGEPLRLGGLTLRNRVVMPPMVLFKAEDSPWQPDAAHLDYYGRRARAGTGLVIVEATAAASIGRLARFQLRLWDDAHITAMSILAETIKGHGAAAVVQLHHAGARTRPSSLDGGTPVSPSGIPAARGGPPPRALEPGEIEDIIASFASAARRCLEAGFDGVELHGAHGYLLSQFLSPACNRRSDAWGGPSVAERLRLPLAVVEAVREALGPGPLLGYRLGAAEYIPGGLPLEEGIEAARALAGSGLLDYLHVSYGMPGGKWPDPPEGFGFSQLLWLGSQVKRQVSLPVISVGGIRTGAEAQAALDAGAGDMIAAGRAMLCDAEWAGKALGGRDGEIVLCRDCRRCAHFFPAKKCPALCCD